MRALAFLALWERPSRAPLRASRDQPGRLAQGPEEKKGRLGLLSGFMKKSIYFDQAFLCDRFRRG